jgi:hypothetical protein
VRELQCEARVGDGRAQTADQVRGSLACSVHNGTVRLCCHRSQASVSVTDRCVEAEVGGGSSRYWSGKLGVEVLSRGISLRVGVNS